MNIKISNGMRRLLAVFILCLGVAILSTDFSVQELPQYTEGDIAQQDIIALVDFEYIDIAEMDRLKKEIQQDVHPIYLFDLAKSSNIQQRISIAFQSARKLYTKERSEIVGEIPQVIINKINTKFSDETGINLEASEMELLAKLKWAIEVEQVVLRLIDISMQSFIIDTASAIPKEGVSYDVVRIFSDNQDQITLNAPRNIKTFEEAKQFVSVSASNLRETSEDSTKLGIRIARDALQVNFTYDYSRTQQSTQKKVKSIKPVIRKIDRGLSIVRKGDAVSLNQEIMLAAMISGKDNGLGVWGTLLATIVLCSFIVLSLYFFAASYIRKFSKLVRDIEAMVFLSLLVVLCARLVVEVSFPLSQLIGFGFGSKALWYITPVAAGAMLIRILMNSETALIWIVYTSIFLSLLMDQSVLYCSFFICSGVVAAASLGHTKERLNILKAGLQTGLINAALALMIELFNIYLNSAVSIESSQPLWDVGIAVSGGVISAFIALGLIPLFEIMGFVTDYKMLELGNLNHPLLKQLFIRAPGTYHHSITMAQLSEAAAEAIGANALQAKVACYYHDIGKSLQPHFFIENQRGINPHDSLQPHQSARVIMTHVTDGATMAEQNNLPKPILNAIWMHHGTGVIKYFYIKALELASPEEIVDEQDFRYPGKRPNTKEAGIIFLADRVEAACRTLKEPNKEDFQGMIQQLVNGAITDRQLEECPLTIKEIYTIMEVFTQTMMSIYHHRIEYPSLPEKKTNQMSSVITLEAPNPLFQDHKDGN
jgi:cyclic-di-AMP phosphodiesterase PgpH